MKKQEYSWDDMSGNLELSSKFAHFQILSTLLADSRDELMRILKIYAIISERTVLSRDTEY